MGLVCLLLNLNNEMLWINNLKHCPSIHFIRSAFRTGAAAKDNQSIKKSFDNNPVKSNGVKPKGSGSYATNPPTKDCANSDMDIKCISGGIKPQQHNGVTPKAVSNGGTAPYSHRGYYALGEHKH